VKKVALTKDPKIVIFDEHFWSCCGKSWSRDLFLIMGN